MNPTRFEIRIADRAITDLRQRLARTRWTDEVHGAGWDYGTNLSYLRELVRYWQHGAPATAAWLP